MSGNADVQQKFAEAQALEARGDIAAAEAAYRRLLAVMPGQPVLLARLALVRKAVGAFGEAESLLRRAILAEPGEAPLHNNLGNVLRAQGRLADAEASYRKALALKPDYGEAAYNMGAALEDAGRNEDALAAYGQASKLGFSHATVWARISAVHLNKGDANEALSSAEQAIAADPKLFDAHYYKGLALANLERFNDAVLALKEALAIRPQSIEAMQALANNLRASDRSDEALDIYWRMIDLEPSLVSTHEYLNRLAWTTGRDDIFLKSFSYVRERQGDDPNLLASEAALRVQRNDLVGAEALLMRARTVFPEHGGANALMARLLAMQGRYQESFEAFTQAIRTAPAAMVHRNDFGFALLQGKEPAQALAQFETAWAANPTDQLALAGMSSAYRALGDSRYRSLVNHNAFVRVYSLKLPPGFADVRAFNAVLAEELLKLHTMTTAPLEQTLRGGTQTQGLLFLRKLKAIEQVREQIAEAVGSYVREMEASTDHPLLSRKQDTWSFTHSWSCKLRSSGFHTNHVHPMGWISSAYYVSLPSELDDKHGWLKFGETNLGLGEDDRPEHFVKPEIGKLALFPSYFWHGTVPFESAADRLTIAFDVVPGTIETSAIGASPY